MKCDWSHVRCKDFISFNPSLTLKKGDFARKYTMESINPFSKFVKIPSKESYNGGAKFQNNDTIFARITPCLENGKTAFICDLNFNEIAFGSTEFIVLRSIEGISDPQFIYYLATSPKFRSEAIKSMTGSSGRQRVQLSSLSELQIELPPLEEQQKIGKFLSNLDEKIKINNQINDNLEQQAQELFKAWFVKFLPFNERIPVDWKEVSFSSFLNLRYEKSIDSSIKMYAVTDNGIYPRDQKFNKSLRKKDTFFKVIHDTDLVFGMSRKILNWGIMRERIGGVSAAYNVFRVDKLINSRYLESYIRANIDKFNNLIKPAAREGQGIDRNALLEKAIILPPQNILDKYYIIENPIMDSIIKYQLQNSSLSKIRDLMLSKLISGEIDISEIDV